MRFPENLTVDTLFVGKSATHWEGRPPSAIEKHPVAGRCWLTSTGLRGDEQADRVVHGGPEKALHHYPADHYSFWKDRFPQRAGRFVAGGFGENLSTTGLTEDLVCIGDILLIGGARVQITQGRQPCWKLSAWIDLPEMALRFQQSGRTGWYYRVLEEGFLQSGDRIALEHRPYPDWPLSRVIAARFDPSLDPAIAQTLSDIAELSSSWHRAFMKKRDPTYVEDTDLRLKG